MNRDRTLPEGQIIALVTALQFINITDFMMVMPLGPDFARALGMDVSWIGIVAGAYTLAAAVVAVLCAKYLDRFDRKPALIIAIGGLGVPFGLELARLYGWQAPFIVVGGAGLLLAVFVAVTIPRMRGHLEGVTANGPLLEFLWRPTVRESMVFVALMMFSGFMLFPHLSAYFQFNLDYPREKIGLLYMVGGAVSFVIMQVAGRYTDRIGSVKVAWVSSLLLSLLMVLAFIMPVGLPVMVIFVWLMGAVSIRGVAAQALLSKVPPPSRRASFLAIQSATQHGSAGLAAAMSSWILVEQADGSLGNIAVAAYVLIACVMTLPLMMKRVQDRITPY
jgi:predicted MFS family arabinose efflux permease